MKKYFIIEKKMVTRRQDGKERRAVSARTALQLWAVVDQLPAAGID